MHIQSVGRIRREILDLPRYGTTQCDERIQHINDQINALRDSSEKEALSEELVSLSV